MDPSSSNVRQVYISKELCSLIKSVKNVMTWGEVLDGLKHYIESKNLFDFNKMKVSCKDDDLEKVFGVSEFTILDIRYLLQKLVMPIPSVRNSAEVSPPIPIVSSTSSKRKTEEEEPTAKKKCECTESCSHAGRCSSVHQADTSPMVLHIPQTPTRQEYDSNDSVQCYETSYVKDTSDESVYFNEDSGDQAKASSNFLPEGIYTVAQTYEVEYEPNSSSEDSSVCDADDESDDSDDFLSSLNSIISVVCKTDSDQEFWADKSSDEHEGFDAEISESDCWKCSRCSSVNNPPNRFCLKCFDTRKGWLASEETKRKKHRKPRSKRKKVYRDSLHTLAKKEQTNPMSFDVPGTSKESLENKLCLLCCSKPVDSSIIHGKYAHSICCYRCAKRLQHSNERCPICRRTIEKVVYQISTL